MTDLETELARKSIGSVAEPLTRVSRQFLADVLAALRAKNKEIADLKARVAAMPPEPPAYDLVAQIAQSDARGDVRNEFARRAAERAIS